MSEEDKKLQKDLVDEMMKVYETNPNVMLYMQALMECYEKLEVENKQLKEKYENAVSDYEQEHFKIVKAIEYIKEHIKYECDMAFNGMQFYSYHLYDFSKEELLKILGDKDIEK